MTDGNWSKQTYTVKEVVYELGLPQTVVVEEGFYSEDEQSSLANGDELEFLSVTEKEFVKAEQEGKDKSNIQQTALIPLDCTNRIHVPDPESTPTIYKSVQEVIENVPRFFRLDVETEVYDTLDSKISIQPGVCLEFLKAEKERGLRCSYCGDVIFLRQKQSGRFIRVPKDTIYTVREVVKRFAFPFIGYFVEEQSLSHTYDDVDEYVGSYGFLGLESKRYLLGNSVVNCNGVRKRGAVVSSEVLLSLDSDQVMQTIVRVMEKPPPVIQKSSSRGKVDLSAFENIEKRKFSSLERNSPSPAANRVTDGKSRTESLDRESSRANKGRPPAPPPRTVSVLTETVRPATPVQNEESSPYQSPSPCANKVITPPELPPRRPSQDKGLVKSGTTIPISLRVFATKPRKDRSPTPKGETYTNTAVQETSDMEECPYMEMKEVTVSLRKVTGRDIPERHRESLVNVHRELLNPQKPRPRIPRFRPVPPVQPAVQLPVIEPGAQKLIHVVSPYTQKENDNTTSTSDSVDFAKMSVEEVVACFQECKMPPRLAKFCADENLDGSFLSNLPLDEFSKDPFNLAPFYIRKLEQIKEGWRPHRLCDK